MSVHIFRTNDLNRRPLAGRERKAMLLSFSACFFINAKEKDKVSLVFLSN